MKAASVAFALVVLLSVVVAQREYVDPYSFGSGFDVIFSNDTSFLDQIDWFHNTGAAGIYVAGQGHIFQVNEWPVFNISYYPVFRNWHSFLDFKTFHDADGNSWAVGPVSNQGFYNNSHEFPGLNYPFSLVGGTSDHRVEAIESPPGFYMMNAVSVDTSSTNQTIAYFAGWHQHHNATEGVNFTLIRTIVNTQNALAQPTVYPVFQYNHTGGDRVYLHGENYVAYNRDFKPWIFHSSRHYHLIVVDPATNSIFRVHTPLDTTQPLSYNETTQRFHVGRGYFSTITGATYDANRGHVFIGLAGWGTLPGRIVVVDVFNMVVIQNITLGQYESNPKALTLNAWGLGHNATELYVGLYGGGGILRINLDTYQITGVATLSPFLRNVYALAMGREHLYFVTNEQHAKVARFPLTNFCPSTCDIMFGFCNNQSQCQCGVEYMQVNPTNNRCEFKPQPSPAPPVSTTGSSSTTGTPAPTTTGSNPTPNPTPSPDAEKIIHKEKSGEIALGILFAITFILAAVGWYLVYKARSNGVYASLINK